MVAVHLCHSCPPRGVWVGCRRLLSAILQRERIQRVESRPGGFILLLDERSSARAPQHHTREILHWKSFGNHRVSGTPAPGTNILGRVSRNPRYYPLGVCRNETVFHQESTTYRPCTARKLLILRSVNSISDRLLASQSAFQTGTRRAANTGVAMTCHQRHQTDFLEGLKT